MCNERIKEAIQKSGFKQWQIAAAYGVSEGTFCRLLRFELSPDKQKRIEEAIEALRKERES